MRQRILKLMKFRRKEETLLPYRNNRNHKRCYYLIEITGITLRILLAIFENKLYALTLWVEGFSSSTLIIIFN